MTGLQLAELCKAQVGSGYVWGGLGYTFSQGRLSQLIKLYPAHYTSAYQAKAKALFGKKVYDCIGLIKHFLWGNKGDGVLRYYGTNGIPDTTANGMLNLCTEKGDISNIPEIPGLMVHMNGHVGVYLGNGKVVEARSIDYGVVETDLVGRGWKSWGKLPGVEYSVPTNYIHIEEYPLDKYILRPVPARVNAGDAMGKVLDWANANYAKDATLEGAINASLAHGVKPIGTVFEGGKVVADGGNGWGFGIDKNGQVHFDRIYKDTGQVAWTDMISAFPVLIFRGEPQQINTGDALFRDRHPRSAVALRGDSVLFVTVDGRQPGKPGMTLIELRDYLVGIGCTEAINLDGGGSSIQVRDRSKTGRFEIVNTPLEHRYVYNVIGAWRKETVDEPEKPEPSVPEPIESGKSITWAELAEKLRADGVEMIML
ncbi:MAG TPA: hypothetical protein GX745_08480 [Clostridiales bacterium]|nr:hypothetical protein [Clostridiales bacterium]